MGAVGRVDLAGAAHLELARGVRHLHPEEATFAAMLGGWRAQQQARMLREKTIADRAQVIRRLASFTNEYPWCWQPAHLEEWVTTLVSERRLAHATVRVYQVALRLFTEYLADARYGWAAECQARFGTYPVPICHEWKTVSHASDDEGRPGRRRFTREELQGLFDYADAQVEAAQTRKRKGALAAYRDATVFKVLYAWGLRRREVVMLDTNIRPRLGLADHPALWVTERGGRLQAADLAARFDVYRATLGLPPELGLHCLRHAYVTHLIEDGADPAFVQRQVGHAWASTTAIYTGVSGDFMNTMLRRALVPTFGPSPPTEEES